MRETEPTRPVVTVACIVLREDAFLLVEEETRNGVRLNQPAGHLEAGADPRGGAGVGRWP